jgi:hypothetical protein
MAKAAKSDKVKVEFREFGDDHSSAAEVALADHRDWEIESRDLRRREIAALELQAVATAAMAAKDQNDMVHAKGMLKKALKDYVAI